MKRSTPLLAIAGGVALALSVIAAPPAYAFTAYQVSTLDELTAALAACEDGDWVLLEADISTVDPLEITCDLELYIESYVLSVGSLNLAAATSLTIDDRGESGRLVAVSNGGPGIWVPPTATLVIDGGEITATGGSSSPGIGGSPFDGSGSVTINGGQVHATGNGFSAGIGGGFFGGGAALTVTGGSVEAFGAGMAGIGAGGNGSVGTTMITGGTVVINGYTDTLNAHVAGPLTITGTGLLSLIDGFIGTSVQFGVGITIGAGGQLVGVLGDETVGGTISGDALVQNDGVIGLDASRVLAPVEGNDFTVGFDPQNGDPAASVRLFAPDFASGYRSVPAPPPGTAWNTAPDGGGDWFTPGTPVAADLTLYAIAGGFADLAYRLAVCIDGAVVVATEDLTGGELVIGCDVTLDLEGHALAPTNVVVGVGHTLTVDDTSAGGSLITGTHADGLAGIGVPVGAGLVIRAGHIVADGGGINSGAAGIGGDVGESAGEIVIEGGVVRGTTSVLAAGIGGGDGGDGGTLTITGGSVYAGAGGMAAAAGGGRGGDGGDVFVGAGAILETVGGANTVGPGTDGTGFGSLTVAGVLRIMAPFLRIPDSNAAGAEVVIEPGGEMLGRSLDPMESAEIVGDGQIDNHGVIQADASLVADTITVNDHDYLVGFDAQDGAPAASVRLFAPDFASGYRSVPAPPAGTAWNTTADGSGDWFTSDTLVTADLTLFAAPEPGLLAALQLVPSASTVDQEGSLTFVVTGTDRYGNPVDAAGVVLSSSVATDVVDGLTVTFPHASPHVITATLDGVATSTTIEVVPTPTAPASSSTLASSGAALTAPLWLLASVLLAGGAAALALGWRARRGIRVTIRRR